MAVISNAHTWVKVRCANGEWIGGWFTKGSFATTYPEAPAFYIAQQWSISPKGTFISALQGPGLFVTIKEDDIVIWTRPDASKESEDAQ